MHRFYYAAIIALFFRNRMKRKSSALFWRSGKSIRTCGGFTLVELMLVMLVTIILFGAAVSGMIRSQRTFTFNSASLQISELVREARSFAVTGKAQLDYTDYDNDGCKTVGVDGATHDTECAAKSVDDYVTPANYGVYFGLEGHGEAIVILFADLHGGVEGKVDKPSSTTPLVYESGKDLVLKVFEVPKSLELVLYPLTGVQTEYSIFYSPIFADFNHEGDDPDPFFIYGLKEKNGDVSRCFAIHPVSGVP